MRSFTAVLAATAFNAIAVHAFQSVQIFEGSQDLLSIGSHNMNALSDAIERLRQRHGREHRQR